MLLDTPTLILLSSSSLLISVILMMYNGILYDIYGQIHDIRQLPKKYKQHIKKYHSIFILLLYSAFAGYPFFMGSLAYHKYYTCLDTIIFGSVCGLLFITYIEVYHQELMYNLRSFSQDICDNIANTATTFFAVCIMISYLFPLEIWYMMVPISGITPIVIYFWIRDTYYQHRCNAIIMKYILPCLYGGIVLGALAGAQIRYIYGAM